LIFFCDNKLAFVIKCYEIMISYWEQVG